MYVSREFYRERFRDWWYWYEDETCQALQLLKKKKFSVRENRGTKKFNEILSITGFW